MVDSQSTALIHLATIQCLVIYYLIPSSCMHKKLSECHHSAKVDTLIPFHPGRQTPLQVSKLHGIRRNCFKEIDKIRRRRVINHGISEEMMSEAISLNKEFFGMAAEEKAGFYCEDFYHNIRLYTSGYNYYAEDHPKFVRIIVQREEARPAYIYGYDRDPKEK
ncbi:hypothetical protein LguiB_032078 [Lonicera macranthoides]